jgi:hypothetical protein
VPKYEVWWKSTTDHRAVIEAKNIEEARDIGWAAMDSGDVEFEACDTEWDYDGVDLIEGE